MFFAKFFLRIIFNFKKDTSMIKKIFLSILVCFVLSSCQNGSQSGAPLVRIVNSDGIYRPIQKYTPLHNAQLQQQKNEQLYNQNTNVATQDFDEKHIAPLVREKRYETKYNKFHDNFGPAADSLGERNATATSISNLEPVFEPTQDPNQANRQKAKLKYKLGSVKKSAPKTAKPTIKRVRKAVNKPKTYKKVAIATPKTPIRTTKGIFVQVGSYGSKDKAISVLKESKKIASGFVKRVTAKDKEVYKIFLGPAPNKNEATKLLIKTKNSGFKNAFVTQLN